MPLKQVKFSIEYANKIRMKIKFSIEPMNELAFIHDNTLYKRRMQTGGKWFQEQPFNKVHIFARGFFHAFINPQL